MVNLVLNLREDHQPYEQEIRQFFLRKYKDSYIEYVEAHSFPYADFLDVYEYEFYKRKLQGRYYISLRELLKRVGRMREYWMKHEGVFFSIKEEENLDEEEYNRIMGIVKEVSDNPVCMMDVYVVFTGNREGKRWVEIYKQTDDGSVHVRTIELNFRR